MCSLPVKAPGSSSGQSRLTTASGPPPGCCATWVICRPASPAAKCEFPGGQVEQAQPVPEPVLAHGPLGPDQHIVAVGPAAFVVLGQLVAGHDGHQPPAGERNQPGDLTAPAQHGLGNPGRPVLR